MLVSIDNGKTWGNAPVFLRLTSAILLSDKRRHGRLFPKAPRVPQGDAIPHEVVGLTVKKGYTLVRGWREYLRLTQAEVAERMGISQAALSQMEAEGKRLRKVTLEKLAAAMGIGIEQLR